MESLLQPTFNTPLLNAYILNTIRYCGEYILNRNSFYSYRTSILSGQSDNKKREKERKKRERGKEERNEKEREREEREKEMKKREREKRRKEGRKEGGGKERKKHLMDLYIYFGW